MPFECNLEVVLPNIHAVPLHITGSSVARFHDFHHVVTISLSAELFGLVNVITLVQYTAALVKPHEMPHLSPAIRGPPQQESSRGLLKLSYRETHQRV